MAETGFQDGISQVDLDEVERVFQSPRMNTSLPVDGKRGAELPSLPAPRRLSQGAMTLPPRLPDVSPAKMKPVVPSLGSVDSVEAAGQRSKVHPLGATTKANHTPSLANTVTNFKARVYRVTTLGKVYTLVVLFSTCAVMSETLALETGAFKGQHNLRDDAAISIECVTMALFTLELCLRVWSCSFAKGFDQRHPSRSRLRFLMMPSTLFDLGCILPLVAHLVSFGHLGLFGGSDVAMWLRVWRTMRVCKFLRYFPSSRTLIVVVKLRAGELVTSLVVSALIVVLLSSLVFVAEHKANSQEFESIFSAGYWAVIHLSTVGYGDVRPITAMGRLFSAVGAVIGIGLFTLPAGIIASGFLDLREEHTRLTHKHVSTLIRLKRKCALSVAVSRWRKACKHMMPSKTASRARLLLGASERLLGTMNDKERSRALHASKLVISAQSLLRLCGGRMDVAMSALIECQQRALGPSPYASTIATLVNAVGVDTDAADRDSGAAHGQSARMGLTPPPKRNPRDSNDTKLP